MHESIAATMYDFMLVCHCNYSYFVYFFELIRVTKDCDLKI